MPEMLSFCERCGAHMVVRVKKRGTQEFLGCSDYPRCTYTEPLPAYLEMIRLGATPLPFEDTPPESRPTEGPP